MKNCKLSAVVAVSPERAWGFLSDFRNDVHWRKEIVRAELTSGEPGRPGSTYRQVARTGKREMQASLETTLAEPGRRVGFKNGDREAVAVWGTYQVKPQGEQTCVELDISLQPRGWLRLFEPLMGGFLKKTTARYLADLKAHLEARRVPGQPAQ